MLLGIPAILSPQLVSVMMEMGHGDELVLADGNFPAAANAARLVRCDGLMIPPLLEAILHLFPMDTYSEKPIGLMAVVPGDTCKTPIWETYRDIYQRRTGTEPDFAYIERYAFYQRAEKAFAIVATGESAQYANIILRKGVVK